MLITLETCYQREITFRLTNCSSQPHTDVRYGVGLQSG